MVCSFFVSGVALFTTLLHEDVAILTGAYFVVQEGMPFGLALAVVYGGVLANNLSIYSLGAAARRLPSARRRLIGARVEHAHRALERHFVPAVLFYRTTPGLMYGNARSCNETSAGASECGGAPIRYPIQN